ncbi:MAG: hypothetical protein IJY71_04005, partial [Clostridia bacterium]|nr:hypothetical protein [Clostridia bacterium]
MKKRIFSLLLIACLLVTGIPLMGTAAAAAEGAGEPFDYSSLYVTDGLKLLYTAYAGDSSVDLANGKWKDLSGNGNDASFVGAAASSTGPAVAWVENRDGNGNGVGYDMVGGTWDGVKDSTPDKTANYNVSSSVYLDISADVMKNLNDSNYTLDYVVNYPSVQWYNTEGVLQTGTAYGASTICTSLSDVFGVLRAIYQRGDTNATLSGVRAVRWFQATAAGGWQAVPSTYLRSELYTEVSRAYAGIYTQSVTRTWNADTITFDTYILSKEDGTKVAEYALNYLQGYNASATLDTTGATKYYVVNNGGKYEIYAEGGSTAIYNNLYTDVDLLQPLASVVSTAENPVYFTVSAGTGTTRSVVYNIGNDNGAAVKTGTFYENVMYARPSSVGSGSIFAKCHRPYYIKDETATLFRMFIQSPVSAYSIRLYDRALNSNEKAQNHFADVAAYYELDMADFAALPDVTKTLIYLAFSDVTLGEGVYADTKAALQEKLSAELAFYGEVKSEFDYNSMYVTDGLKGLYTSFMNNSQVDLVSGIWTNLAEGDGAIGNITLTGAANWGYTDFGTVKLSLAKVNTAIGGSTSAIQLPLDVVGYDNYTIEYFGNLHHYLNEDGTRINKYNETYTPNSYAVRLGYFNILANMYQQASHARLIYTDYTIDGGLNTPMFDPVGNTLNIYGTIPAGATYVASTMRDWYFTGNNGGKYNDNPTDFVYGLKANPAVIGGGAFVKATAENGSVTHSLVNSGAAFNMTVSKEIVDKIASSTVTYMDGDVEKTVEKPAGTTLYDATLFNDMPASYTAIRVYNRALTEVEKAQNLMADICGYYSLDMTEFAALSAEEKAQAYARVGLVLGNFEMNAGDRAAYLADREEAQALVDLLVSMPAMNDYDKLYVGANGEETANGGKLTALWTAYTPDKGVVVSSGIWVDKVNGTFATLEGNLWKTFENGGVGYTVTAGPQGNLVDTASPYYTVEAAKNQYLRLPTSLIVGNPNYTLEMAFGLHNKVYYTDAEGNPTDEIFVNSTNYYVMNFYADLDGDGEFTDLVNTDLYKEETTGVSVDVFADATVGERLEGKYWLGRQDATDASLYNYCRELWSYTEDGGVLTADKYIISRLEGSGMNVAPMEVLLMKDGAEWGIGVVVEVEFVEIVKDAKAIWGYNGYSNQIGNLKSLTMYNLAEGQTMKYHHRFFISEGLKVWDSGARYSGGMWDSSNKMDNNLVNLYSITRNVVGEAAEETQTYTINMNGTKLVGGSVKTLNGTADSGTANFALETEGNTAFFLFNRVPATVYAIRMYDAVLTAEEQAHNAFVDICAFYKLDMGKFAEADAETQAAIKAELAGAVMDAENFAAKKEEYQAAFNCVDPEKEEVAPTVDGIKDGDVLYVTSGFSVSDAFPGEIAKVELKTGEGEYAEIEAPYTVAGNVDATYTVRVTDLAGNETVVVITMKAIASIGEPIADMTVDTVTSADKDTILGVQFAIAAINADKATDDEKAALKGIADNAANLLSVIDATLAEITRIETALALITDSNVTSADKDTLEELLVDIGDLKEAGRLTADEITQVDGFADVVDARLNKIQEVADELEAIEADANFSADTVKVTDEAAVKALQARINAIRNNLTAAELTALSPVGTALSACLSKIDAVKADLAAIDAALGTLTEADVTSAAKAGLTAAIAKIDALVAGNNVTADDKTALGTKKTTATALVAKIDAVKTEYDRITAAVGGYAEATVKSSDKATIEGLKTAAAVLPANLTADEAAALTALVSKMDALVAKIAAVTAAYNRVKDAAATATTAKADLEALVKDAYALLAGTNLTDAEKTAITEKKNAVNVLIASIEAAVFGEGAEDFDDAVTAGLNKPANSELKAAV